jgi:hypothetical protein
MAPEDSAFGAALFDAGWRGFLTAFAVLRFGLAVVGRPSFPLFLAIATPLLCFEYPVSAHPSPAHGTVRPALARLFAVEGLWTT